MLPVFIASSFTKRLMFQIASFCAKMSSPVWHELNVHFQLPASELATHKPNRGKQAVDGKADPLQGEHERKERAGDRRQKV